MTQPAISSLLASPQYTDSALRDRFLAHGADAEAALRELYGTRPDFADVFAGILAVVADAHGARRKDLRKLDEKRLHTPDWFAQAEQIGYTAYVDRFAGNLTGVAGKIGHLQELGVTYLHLLPLLKMQSGENDGGFAVADYGEVDPLFGSNSDLESLAGKLRKSGISLCIDLTLNHTARDHKWALAARSGDPKYKAYYYMYPDRTEPDAFEQNLGEVFPNTAPGNFTHVPETGDWVWTTFYPYQWDLNYSNPDVLRSILAAMLALANAGVEVFRLDAAPFLWKRKGTDCMNQPEVFSIIRALQALLAIAAPAAILKAEAVVPSYRLIRYLGAGSVPGKGCQLAYNTTLMVLSWGALAKGNVDRLVNVLQSLPPLPAGSAWLNYVRCHDDIGWGVLFEENADYDAADWREYAADLRRFYRGEANEPFACGQDYQETSTNGTAASLCGLEHAIQSNDADGMNLAIDRLLALYTVAYAYGGIPLINMGDEIGLLNDPDYATHERYDGDGRWLHRGFMDWLATTRETGQGHAARIFASLAKLGQIRKRSSALSASIAHAETVSDGRVLSLHHRHNGDDVWVLVNFSSQTVKVNTPEGGPWHDELSGELLAQNNPEMPPFGRLWLTKDKPE